MREEMTEVNRAHNVCRACVLRKKGCDKLLPACGYCTKRGILCKYGTTKSGAQGRRPYPGRSFVAIPTEPPAVGSWNELEPIQAWVDPLFQSVTCASSPSFDRHVHQYVCHSLGVTNLTWEGLGQRYFRTFDRSLPIISPQLFRQVALRVEDTENSPPAEYSILLLGMLLVIGLPDLEPGLSSHPLDRERIYMTVKALFSQAQAKTCASLQLLQAALLIAACEHISGRPEVAYISVVSCIGMARMLGLGEASVDDAKVAAGKCQSRSMEMEVANVAWATATLERIILCETQQKHLQPLTELPNFDYGKLSDLQHWQVVNGGQPNDHGVPKPISLSSAREHQSSMTKEQVQVVSFLDQALSIARSVRDDRQRGQLELAELDAKIHRFLGTVLNIDWKTQDGRSSIVALAVRLLFLLHRMVIDEFTSFPDEIEHQERMRSWDALDAACNMVVDITRYRKLDEEVMMPICCYYNLRKSIEHLQGQKGRDGSGRTSALQRLLESEKQYRMRWCFG